MFKFIFMYVFKIRATWLLLILGLYPLLIFLAQFLNSNFLSLSASQAGSVSFLETFIAIYDTQQKSMLSLIIVAYLASILFYNEISTSRLLFFKNQNRNKIFNNKFLSIIIVYITFLIILCVSSIIVYLYFVNNHDYSSHSLLLKDTKYNHYLMTNLIGLFFTDAILIFLSLIASIRFNTGVTIITLITGFILIKVTDSIDKIKLFPSNFIKLDSNISFSQNLLIMSVITLVYIVVIYLVSKLIFKKLQY